MKYLIKDFKPVSLKELDSVALMTRTDTKFILNRKDLENVLEVIYGDYKILEINDNRLMTYNSVYLDTDNYKFYFDHHRGIAKRIKVRFREYVESKLRFLEVKQKDYKGNTVKSRIQTLHSSSFLNEKEIEYVKSIVKDDTQLKESLRNGFKRFTLVNMETKERVTVDTDISYNNESFNSQLCIVELKQEKLNRGSGVFQALKMRRIHPYSISKYCIGMTYLRPKLKSNNFKPKILKLNKITAY